MPEQKEDRKKKTLSRLKLNSLHENGRRYVTVRPKKITSVNKRTRDCLLCREKNCNAFLLDDNEKRHFEAEDEQSTSILAALMLEVRSEKTNCVQTPCRVRAGFGGEPEGHP
uniref:FLYWCH-type domain-containing protein n=1 Tax=Romanomermis culicivorax TaxID=13658 RepID=A0A915HVM9_ROMCU